MTDTRTAVAAMGGACLTTPLGLYSQAIGSEAASLLPAGILLAETIRGWQRRPLRLHRIGAATAGLLVIRPYLAAYAWPALWLAMCGADERAPVRHRDRLCRALILPSWIVGGLLIVGVTNSWVTGDWRRSPYVFSDGHFRSLDPGCPHLAQVLLHPYHGLVTSHPLFLALPLLAIRGIRQPDSRVRMIVALTACAVLINAWFQGSWYYWWMAGFPGNRGLILASIPLIVGGAIAWKHGPRGPMFLAVSMAILWGWLLFQQEWRTVYVTLMDLQFAQQEMLGLQVTGPRMARLFVLAGFSAMLVWSRFRRGDWTALITVQAYTLSFACVLSPGLTGGVVFDKPVQFSLLGQYLIYGGLGGMAWRLTLGRDVRRWDRLPAAAGWVSLLAACILYVRLACQEWRNPTTDHPPGPVYFQPDMIAAARFLQEYNVDPRLRRDIEGFLAREQSSSPASQPP